MSELALRDFRRPGLWLIAWILMLKATLIVCVIPLSGPRSPLPHLDKLEHLLGYAVLSAWAGMIFASARARTAAAFGLVLMGAGIEALQSLLPWRSADALDLVANTLGVVLGMLVCLTPLPRWLQRVDRALP